MEDFPIDIVLEWNIRSCPQFVCTEYLVKKSFSISYTNFSQCAENLYNLSAFGDLGTAVAVLCELSTAHTQGTVLTLWGFARVEQFTSSSIFSEMSTSPTPFLC